MRKALCTLGTLVLAVGCADSSVDQLGDVASQVTTHAPATPADLLAHPASDDGASTNIQIWPTGSSAHAAIAEATPANPPDSSLVKTAIGSGSGWFTVGLGLAPSFEVGQVAVHFQHSLGNGATNGAVRVALVVAGQESRAQTVASTTTWTTSTVTFSRRAIGMDIADASDLAVKFYLDNATAGGAGNVRVAWTASDVWKLKPLIKGTMTTGYNLPNYKIVPPAVEYAALNVDWDELEPDANGDQAFDGNPWQGPGWATIDKAVAAVSAGGNLKGIRLRVMAGQKAPLFVKGLCTKSVGCAKGVSVLDPQHGTPYCVPCFWQASYQHQYEDLMREIARRYDRSDAILEVVDSACMTTFAEPFVRAHGHGPSNDNLLAAGYTFAGDLACHQAALDIAQDDFIRTRTSLALNPWDEPCKGTGCGTADVKHSFSDTASFVLDDPHGRPSLGRKLVLQANHLNWQYHCASGGSSYSSDACLIQNEAGPTGFQTTMNTLLCQTRDNACNTWSIVFGGVLEGLSGSLRAGALGNGSFVEISTGFSWGTVDRTAFAARDAALEANSP
jgi:hypothetical protein